MLKDIELKIKKSKTMRKKLMVGNTPVPTKLEFGKSNSYNGSVRQHQIYPNVANVTKIDKICQKYPMLNFFILAHENGHIYYGDTTSSFWFGWAVLLSGFACAYSFGWPWFIPFLILMYPAQMYQSRLWEYRADRIAIRVLIEFMKSDEVIAEGMFKSPEEFKPILDFFTSEKNEKNGSKFSFSAYFKRKYENFISTHPANENRKRLILREIQREFPEFRGFQGVPQKSPGSVSVR